MAGLMIDATFEGLELLAEALQNAPRAVAQAAETAAAMGLPLVENAAKA